MNDSRTICSATARRARPSALVASLAVGALLVAAACSDDKDDSGAATTIAAPTTIAGTAVSTAASAAATPPSTPADLSDVTISPVLARVLAPPIPAPSTDGKIHLAYELVLSNALTTEVTVTSITSTGDGKQLQALDGDALRGTFRPLGGDLGTTTLKSGQGALVWLDAVVDTAADVPTELAHTIDVSVAEPIPPIVPKEISETPVARVAVSTATPIEISPPLKGAKWLDGNSCCDLTAHRAAVNAIGGELWAPERFAIDYVQLDDQDRIFTGPVDSLDSYAYYGADVVAVADGPIVRLTTGRPEQTPGANPSGLTVDEYGGNYVVQDIGNGHFAFYAHLQTDNPIPLEIGQQLKKGETIAPLGNTGNSDSPHLHFHVMDSDDPLASNGLPFVFESMQFDGQVAAGPSFDAAATTGTPFELDTAGAGTRTAQSPLFRDVMTYAG